MTAAAFNRELGLKINHEVWNGRQLDKIGECFAEDCVADYSPASVWREQQHVREAVERAHATFAGFREEIKTIVARRRPRRRALHDHRHAHRSVGTGAGHRPAGRLRRDRHHDGPR